jgi:hypothetical protein
MSVGSSGRVITVLGDPIIHDEDLTAAIVYPGYLVAYDGSGYKLNNTANKIVGRTVALEREELNKDIDQPYAVNDQVKVGAFAPGQRAMCVIPSGSNIAKGDYLTPDGYGRLVAASSNQPIARAVEAVNNTNGNGNSPISTNGAGTDARIIVEFV